MNNKELKKYVENKIKILQSSMNDGSSFFDCTQEAYEVGYEDGELKGAYDALLMVLVLMEKSDE